MLMTAAGVCTLRGMSSSLQTMLDSFGIPVWSVKAANVWRYRGNCISFRNYHDSKQVIYHSSIL